MKLDKQTRRNEGFTLVEMIGVLAVIAILAAMLIPKVFEAMHSSRINNAISGINTIKDATVEHVAKWGKFATAAGADLTLTAGGTNVNFDTVVLLAEGRIDKAFWPKIGSQKTALKPFVNVAQRDKSGLTGIEGDAEYDLDGYTAPAVYGSSITTSTLVVEVIIREVTLADARELSLRLDGAAMSNPEDDTGLALDDRRGRVKYAGTGITTGKTDVFIYITSR